MRVEIDGVNVHTEEDLHRILSEALDFGPFYGANLNALWDRLSTDVERPVEIVWRNSERSKEYFGESEFQEIRSLLVSVLSAPRPSTSALPSPLMSPL
ncbi:barstar family protein [Streptomyces sp. NPDC052236]|uniref:barstar family protein n=1 Tax=Streptomyces sp. NPDC052236 TaxID=3365686 RepID=UPI0037D4FF52